MNYSDGRLVKVGDRVTLANSSDGTGTVVCSIDTDEYSAQYPKEQWGYLKRGVMIEFEAFGLTYYEEADSGLQFLKRGTHEG